MGLIYLYPRHLYPFSSDVWLQRRVPLELPEIIGFFVCVLLMIELITSGSGALSSTASTSSLNFMGNLFGSTIMEATVSTTILLRMSLQLLQISTIN